MSDERGPGGVSGTASWIMCRPRSVKRRIRADGAPLSVEQGRHRLLVRVTCARGSNIQLGGHQLENCPGAGALDGRSAAVGAAMSVDSLRIGQIGQLMCR